MGSPISVVFAEHSATNVAFLIMRKAEDLTEAEKCIIAKEIGKGTPPKVMATSIGRHVDTI